MPTAGLYIHIPFCRIKCMYCDFYSITERDDDIPSFFKALLKEIQLCTIDTSKWKINTIFIGGGTPSLIHPDLIIKLINTLSEKFDISKVAEFTIEANPGEAEMESLKEFHDLGINRLSIGVQSLEPELLNFLTRNHSPSDVITTFENARKAGYKNINCDLIYNIPNQTIDIWKRDLQKVIDLQPDHISCYSLTVEKNTKLFRYVADGTITMPSDDESINYYEWTQSSLSNNNFIQYEISNWKKPNRECMHNIHYWKINPYLSFGPSAHSFDGEKRYSNVRSLDKYIRLIKEGKTPIDFSEDFSEKNFTNELIGFGLRISDGINLNRIPNKFKKSVKKSIEENQIKWGNYFIFEKDRLKLTNKGFAFSDAIAVDLMI